MQLLQLLECATISVWAIHGGKKNHLAENSTQQNKGSVVYLWVNYIIYDIYGYTELNTGLPSSFPSSVIAPTSLTATLCDKQPPPKEDCPICFLPLQYHR